MNVKEFINMIRDNRKKDATIYINSKNENLGMIPPGYFTHTEELEKVMNKVGDLEVESFFIGKENPAKAFCFSDLFISLKVSDKVSKSVSNEDILESLQELHKKVDKLPSCKDIRDIKTDYHGDDWSML